MARLELPTSRATVGTSSPYPSFDVVTFGPDAVTLTHTVTTWQRVHEVTEPGFYKMGINVEGISGDLNVVWSNAGWVDDTETYYITPYCQGNLDSSVGIGFFPEGRKIGFLAQVASGAAVVRCSAWAHVVPGYAGA